MITQLCADSGLVEHPSKLLARASLRLLLSRCRAAEALPSLEQQSTLPSPASLPTPTLPPSTPTTPASSGWQESWPAKLSPEKTAALRRRFEEDYPTELLDSESFPSARLLALTSKMISDREIRWLPWKFRLSSKSQEDSMLLRPKKQPRLSELSDLLLDDAPTREIHDGPASYAFISQMLSLASTSIALCQGAHLGALKMYNKKFLQLCFTKYEPASNLRGPTSLEAQAADKRSWEILSDLVNQHSWKLDDALHEVSEVRSDLASLLAPRPHVSKRMLEGQDQWRFRPNGRGRGAQQTGRGGKGRDGKGNPTERLERGGKGKTSQKGGDKNGQAPQGKWLSTIFMEGKKHTLCMRYQSGQCKDPTSCRYVHKCAVPKQDGTACGEAEVVDETSLCVPAQPSGSQGHLISPHAAVSEVSAVARAIEEHRFDFSTCLSLLEESFSSQAASALKDPAVTQSDAYFNLGAFGFNDGRRCGVFQRTEQFSDIARFLNAFLRLQFPSASWTSVCVSHNVRTLLHTDAGNEVGSFNHSISLGNFSGGEIWITPALHSSAVLVPPPTGSASDKHKVGSSTLGERVVLTHLRSLGFPLPGAKSAGEDLLSEVQAHLSDVPACSVGVTAEYPAALADRYAGIIAPLFGNAASHTDGGGIYSLPDWSYGPRYAADQLKPLRLEWRRNYVAPIIIQTLFGYHLRIVRLGPVEKANRMMVTSFWFAKELIEEELQAGFLEEVDTIEEAYRRWGKERDIQASYPLREDSEPVSGFSLDVKGAHKTSRVREKDRGLLGLRQQDRLFFYKVCPFGATFSSHWFARLGGFFTRCLHLLLWIPHVLLLYVDDLLLYQNAKALPLSACLTLAFCSCFHIPLSWKKLQMGPVITWIGWQLNLGTACYTLPDEKRNKLQSQVRECLGHRLVSRKQLDKLLGLLQWILHGFPSLRPWLCTLYDDMHRPLGTNVSIPPTLWPGISNHLNDKLVFTSCPTGTHIQPGSTLLSARHVELKCLKDLHKVPVSSKRLWLRVADPSSSRRKLSQASRETLEFFLYLSSREWRPRPLCPPTPANVESAADAFGKGNDCGVGGWIRFSGGATSWFSHRYTVSDFTSMGLPMQPNANLDISSYETLAQCFVLLCFWKLSGSGRLAVTLPALSDNTGAESVCNRLYTSKVPLSLFVRKLSMWSSVTGVHLDCSHISGEKNDDADMLSRWDGQSELPERFRPEHRVHISLSDFWHIRFAVTLHPPDAFLKWQLPEPHQLGPSNRGSNVRR
ncbi:unnamed protein product [Symbiodinium sp. KB8]|nr:unnamed protein product [Symbiodinium sp. KB8]